MVQALGKRLRYGPHRRTPVPWGLMGALLALVAAESFVARHEFDFTHWGISSRGQSGRASRALAPGCETLCFGDSQVKLGVLPRVIEAETGRRAYNLSICGAQAPASYFLLRRTLEAGAQPSALVVDYKPNLLVGGPRDFLRDWTELLTPRECLELAWRARDATFFASAILGRLLPSVPAQHDLRSNIQVALRGGSDSWREGNLRFRCNWYANKGAQVTAESSFQSRVAEWGQQLYMPNVWWCDKVNAVYIRKFLDLAAVRSSPVFWLLPPISPEVQARREQTGVDAKHAQFVAKALAQHRNLVVVDGRHSGYGPPAFVDPVHLNRCGAAVFSAELATLLCRAAPLTADGARWIALSPFRDRPVGETLEALDMVRVTAQFEEARRWR